MISLVKIILCLEQINIKTYTCSNALIIHWAIEMADYWILPFPSAYLYCFEMYEYILMKVVVIVIVVVSFSL
jgi:hypothetical protein